ncbi:MAG: 4'-phosphopantetheinyl transferase superfamily protein [Treponema sp.]|jgi:hypothetical protein|nr:4'-phosphopantetheinyl transferase superfamily protein [Treponema sp.]
MFLLGLSLSNRRRPYAAQHREGRRILDLLDRENQGSGGGDLRIEASGRPVFADRHADFSISHSRGAAAVSCLAVPGWPGLRTGCDIQYASLSRPWEPLAARFFDPAEQGYIAAAPDSRGRAARFYHIWVLKEAFLKLRGLSVTDVAAATVFSAGTPGLRFFLYELRLGDWSPYALAAAAEFPPACADLGEPEFRWFSQERAGLAPVVLPRFP